MNRFLNRPLGPCRWGCVFILTILGFSLSPVWAHKFHASFTKVDFKKDLHALQITLRLFPDDLEQAVNRFAGKKLNYDALPQTEEFIYQYVYSVFQVVDPKKGQMTWKWVGAQWEWDVVWLYLEIELHPDTTEIGFCPTLFFDLHADQSNMLSFHSGDHKETLIYKRGSSLQYVSLRQEQR